MSTPAKMPGKLMVVIGLPQELQARRRQRAAEPLAESPASRGVAWLGDEPRCLRRDRRRSSTFRTDTRSRVSTVRFDLQLAVVVPVSASRVQSSQA
jgi:hypothetical protein